MKNSIFLIAAFGFLFLSCSGNENNSGQSSSPAAKEPAKGDIKGTWHLSDDAVTGLVIKQDSIYYPDQQLTLPYKLEHNAIIISDDDTPKDTIQYEMRGNDSLILTIDNYPEVYLRSAQ